MRGDIRSWEASLDSRCNWAWLNGAFGGTAISVTDIDFLIERRGLFLIGEVKPHRNAIRQGQAITFKALAALPQFTAFFLVGDIAEHEIAPREMLVVGETGWLPVDRRGLVAFCAEWFAYADDAIPIV